MPALPGMCVEIMSDKPEQTPRTAQEWLDAVKAKPVSTGRLWQNLTFDARLRTVLNADHEEREILLTMARDSQALVRAMAPDDFAQSVLAAGPHDAGTLVRLSSDEQFGFLLDLTGWSEERFAPSRYETWLPLLMDAGSNRVLSWLNSSDLEVLSLLFAHWFKVVKWLPSQDEQEPPDTLPNFTLDGVYHLEFHNQQTAGFVAQVLVLLKSENPQRYLDVLEAMIWEPAAQLAEDGLRWRNGRMTDAGYPSRTEAMELWAKPLPGEAEWRDAPTKASMGFPDQVVPRKDPICNTLPDQELLPALCADLDPKVYDGLAMELANVANCGVVAFNADPADAGAVSRAARESLSLVNLGLELLSQDHPGETAAILERLPLAVLARQGAQTVRQLNYAGWKLVKEGWLKEIPTGVMVLDAPLDRAVAGLIFPQPRCYDPNLGEDREYRAFRNLADLAQARRQLQKAWFWGRLLHDLLGLKPKEVRGLFETQVWPEDPEEIKTSAILGTWLARRALGLEGLAPIGEDELPRALAALQEGLSGSLSAELDQSCCTLTDPDEAALAGQLVRGVLGTLQYELGRVDPKIKPNPAFIYGIIVERQ